MKLKSVAVFALMGAVAADEWTDYFFRFIGGNAITDGQRLRSNNSSPYYSPGVTPPPQNPQDHFQRITVNTSSPSVLNVVPTNPHPPPVPGYYGLSDLEGVADAYRLVYSYRLDDEGPGFRYTEWDLHRTQDGRILLRYAGDVDSEWRWIAVKERTGTETVDKWVPWYVKPSSANIANLTSWEYDIADLELVAATGPVNSLAPGGVQE